MWKVRGFLRPDEVWSGQYSPVIHSYSGYCYHIRKGNIIKSTSKSAVLKHTNLSMVQYIEPANQKSRELALHVCVKKQRTTKQITGWYSALLLWLGENHLPVLGKLGDFLPTPFDFHLEFFYRSRRHRRGIDGLFGRFAKLFILGRWFFLLRLGCFRRAGGQPSRSACDLVDFLGGKNLVDTGAAGLEQNSCRAVELKEKLSSGGLA